MGLGFRGLGFRGLGLDGILPIVSIAISSFLWLNPLYM